MSNDANIIDVSPTFENRTIPVSARLIGSPGGKTYVFTDDGDGNITITEV